MDLALRRGLHLTVFRAALGVAVMMVADDLLSVLNLWDWSQPVKFIAPPLSAGWWGAYVPQPLPLVLLIAGLLPLGLVILLGFGSAWASAASAAILIFFSALDFTFVRDSRTLLVLALLTAASLGSPGLDAAFSVRPLLSRAPRRESAAERALRFDPVWIAGVMLQPLFYGGVWALHLLVVSEHFSLKHGAVALGALMLAPLAAFRRTRLVSALMLAALALADPLHWFSVAAVIALLGAAVLLAMPMVEAPIAEAPTVS